LNEGKAASFAPARQARQRDLLPLKFVATRLDQADSQDQRLLYPEKAGSREELMKSAFLGLAFAVLLAAAPIQSAKTEDAPDFMKQTFPEQALKAAVEEQKAVMGNGALDAKTKQLIALGVAAQIPCQYCVYGHTAMAKKAGATDAQIKEAIAAAALTRKWSTVLNGTAYDFESFKNQINTSLATQ
jgi:AhpD family alkylhydroperoxidase